MRPVPKIATQMRVSKEGQVECLGRCYVGGNMRPVPKIATASFTVAATPRRASVVNLFGAVTLQGLGPGVSRTPPIVRQRRGAAFRGLSGLG